LLGVVIASTWFALASFDSGKSGVALGLSGLAMIALTWPRIGRWLPERGCQVQRSRLAKGSRERMAFLWGAELGLGFCTFIVTPAMYALPAVSLAQASALASAAPCVMYGLARGATIAAFAIVEARREALGGDAMPSEIGNLRKALRAPLAVMVAVAIWQAIV
jgi:hypothetical protein